MANDRKQKIKSWYLKLMPEKTAHENIIQYIFRQFYFPDSAGHPSLTVTILIYTMIIIGAVTVTEVINAVKIDKVLDAAGRVTKETVHGFSDLFLILVTGLSVVVTGWYRQRQNKLGSAEQGEVVTDTIAKHATDYVKQTFSKLVRANPAAGAVANVASTVAAEATTPPAQRSTEE